MASKRGRPLRATVAQALRVEQMKGVHRVDTYPEDPGVVYVRCTPQAWAEIQYRAAQHSGVEHTGKHHQRVKDAWFGNR